MNTVKITVIDLLNRKSCKKLFKKILVNQNFFSSENFLIYNILYSNLAIPSIPTILAYIFFKMI